MGWTSIAIGAAGVIVSIVGLVVDRPTIVVAAPATVASRPATTASSATTTATTTATTLARETPAAFLDALGAAFRSGDDTFLVARLHPVVLEHFSEAVCRQHASTIHDATARFTVTSVGAPAPFDYTAGGKTTTVPDAFEVEVDWLRHGEPIHTTLHLAPVGERLAWFTDCSAAGG